MSVIYPCSATYQRCHPVVPMFRFGSADIDDLLPTRIQYWDNSFLFMKNGYTVGVKCPTESDIEWLSTPSEDEKTIVESLLGHVQYMWWVVTCRNLAHQFGLYWKLSSLIFFDISSFRVQQFLYMAQLRTVRAHHISLCWLLSLSISLVIFVFLLAPTSLLAPFSAHFPALSVSTVGPGLVLMAMVPASVFLIVMSSTVVSHVTTASASLTFTTSASLE